jgi:hypothetical protein
MFTFIFAFLSVLVGNDQEFQVEKDFKAEWKIIADGKFENYNGQKATTVFVPIDLSKTESTFLQIKSEEDVNIFINSYLVAKAKTILLKTDSLKEKHGDKFLLSVYQKGGIEDLSVQLVSFKKIDPDFNPLRPSNSFSNFILIATLLLCIFFTALLRTNTQLTLDYFNVIKLFSTRNTRDDAQFVLRITSSPNLVFYVFCGLLTSLALLIAARFSADGLSFLTDLQKNTGWYLMEWIIVALVVSLLFIIKLGFVGLWVKLFGWKRDTAGFQFFNFIRMWVLALIVMGTISVLCFSIGLNVNYYTLIKCFCTMLAIGVLLIYLKLLARDEIGAFHLFSYLCASEIFPLVILIKTLLF